MTRSITTGAVGAAFALLVAGLSGIPLGSAHAAASLVPDDAFRACVNARMTYPATHEPTEADLATIKDLSCVNKGITAITGVERMPNLGKIFLGGNKLSSLEPLRGNTKIFSLGLDNTGVDDISVLATMPALSSVKVELNRLGDLSPLAGLKNLTSVTSHKQVVAGEWVADAGVAVPAPTVLNRSGARVGMESGPAGITVRQGLVIYPSPGEYTWTFRDPDNLTFNGTVVVRVGGEPPVVTPKPTPTPVASVTPPPSTSAAPVPTVELPDAALRACVAAALKLAPDAPIPADKAAALTELSCVGKGVVSVVGIGQLPGLTSLTLATNKIVDVAPVAELPALATLRMANNQVVDVTPLATMTTLRTLDVSLNPLTSIAGLRPLVGLEELALSQKFRSVNPGVDSLDGIQDMRQLTSLVANHNQITDLRPLAGLAHLRTVALNNNKVADASPLAGLTGLTSLRLAANQLTSVAPLADLDALTALDLNGNHLQDLAPLGSLPKLAMLGLKAKDQTVMLPSTPAQTAVAAPVARTTKGVAVAMVPPPGLTVVDGMVTYPGVGSYVWTWADKGDDFAGKATVEVVEAPAGAADIPDAALRSCVALAAGLAADTVPTTADLAQITSLGCAGKGVTSTRGLAGARALTSLDLARNPLTDLADVAALTLTRLDLSGTGLTGTTLLTGLHGLDSLLLDDNHLVDLADVDGMATTISALGQTVTLEPITGDEPAQAPVVTDRKGQRVAPLGLPDGATGSPDAVIYPLAGSYVWSFAADSFGVTATQPVTRDRLVAEVHDGALACTAAGNVWVVVERDTGLQSGGCATEFDDGLVALRSAGFTPSGTDFITAIDGYPSSSGTAYWAYWHALPVPAGETPVWTYSSIAATGHHPVPGSVEGWRFTALSPDRINPPPSWTPVIAPLAAPTPTPVVTPTPSAPVAEPSLEPTPTPSSSVVTPTSPTPSVVQSPTPVHTGVPALANTGATDAPLLVVGLLAVACGATLTRRR